MDKSATPTKRRTPVKPSNKGNYKPRDWTLTVRRVTALLFVAEVLLLLLANPYFKIRRIDVEGAHRLSPQRVVAEAGVRPGTNLFLALFKPIQRRLDRDPEIDRSDRLAVMPDRLILKIAERQPRVVLQAAGQYWMVDRHGIPFELVAGPSPVATTLQYTGVPAANSVILGKRITEPWLTDAYHLMIAVEDRPELHAQSIAVDQNMNICLNRGDHLQIKLGQPDDLPEKLAVASKILLDGGDRVASTIAYIDVSSPGQPAVMPRGEENEGSGNGNGRDVSR